MKKRVIHIVRRFSPQEWGGIESAVAQSCSALKKYDIDSKIFATDACSSPSDDLISGVHVRRFPYIFPWFFLSPEAKQQMALKGGNPLCWKMFLALMQEKNLDLIHTHVQHRLGGIARFVARWRKIPYVVTLHGGYAAIPQDQAEKMQEPFANHIEWGKIFGCLLGARRTVEDADAVICVGLDEYEKLKPIYGEKVHYLPNGIHIDRFRQGDPNLFREAYRINPSEKIILCVSRIDYQKDQKTLLRAFAEWKKENPSWLVLIGPITVPAYLEELRSLAKELEVEDRFLVITGLKTEDPLLAGAYKAADLFVLPSKTEPFGIVILEAWAAGTPVVASRVGGIVGFTHHEEDCLQFESGNENELLKMMQRLLNDSVLRQKVIDRASKEVEAYRWEIIAKQLAQIYQSL